MEVRTRIRQVEERKGRTVLERGGDGLTSVQE